MESVTTGYAFKRRHTKKKSASKTFTGVKAATKCRERTITGATSPLLYSLLYTLLDLTRLLEILLLKKGGGTVVKTGNSGTTAH